MNVDDLLRAGRLDDALAALEQQVRADPSNHKLRVCLFQVLAVLGDWERAATQLKTAAELEPLNLPMAQVCTTALACEALRAEVFDGARTPLIFGEPERWVGWLVRAGQMIGAGDHLASQGLRDQAFEEAAAVPGSIDGRPFQWIADADSRLGPVLEAIIDGKYYWVPFQTVKCVQMERPTDLRDLVWLPATFTWVNGGQSVGLIPVRYPGSQGSRDDSIRLGRRTEWKEYPGQTFLGLGQRMLATDDGEFPLLEVRRIDLASSGPDR